MSGKAHVTKPELAVLKRQANAPRHDCAQVERDNVDLHKAFAEALRRMAIANGLLGPARRIDARDLADELGRMGEPGAVEHYIEVELRHASHADRAHAASVPSDVLSPCCGFEDTPHTRAEWFERCRDPEPRS